MSILGRLTKSPCGSDRTDFLMATVKNELNSLSPYFAVMKQQLIGAVQESDTGAMAVIEHINQVHGLSCGQVERIQQSSAQCMAVVDVTRQQGDTPGRS